jgi:hypothetical protein
MKLTACMYICVMISYVRKYSLCGFRKINTNLLYTLTIIIACKEKNININIASIVITLTEINNESHYVAKKKTKKKLLRWDSHSQCKSAGVAKQRLYDHGCGTMIKFVSFVFFFVVYIKVYLM